MLIPGVLDLKNSRAVEKAFEHRINLRRLTAREESKVCIDSV